MLKNISIKNYALIEELQIEFNKGLNIITGETGAGKSILIGALGLLLGERASNEAIRKGSEKAFVEGIFDVESNNSIKKILESNGYDYNNDLIIRRELTLKGSNRCFVNDSPAPLNLVKIIGDELVDFHGQHEHQSLLKTENHLKLLDQLDEEIFELKKSFTSKKEEFEAALSRLKETVDKIDKIKEKKDLYEFQFKEIDSFNLDPETDDKLEEELNILDNAEHLIRSASNVYEGLYESENSVYDQLNVVRKLIEDITTIDSKVEEKLNGILDTISSVEELADYFRSYRDKIDFDPEHAEYLRDRIAQLNILKKKYGPELKDIISYKEKIEQELLEVENFDELLEKRRVELEEKRKSLSEVAVKLSERRKYLAKRVSADMVNELKELGIEHSSFDVKFSLIKPSGDKYITIENEKVGYDDNGIDEVEFYISTNKGEDLKPLVKTASGGEISRVMLALKTILAKNDKLPLLVFDEIDTGVSGRVAEKVGRAMKKLGGLHQIIAITHLPQIAGFGDFHYSISKVEENNRIVSKIKLLNNNERVEEIAKLISGEELTEASIQGAKELLRIAE